MLIEQVDDIVDMRRYLALMEGDIPSSLAATLTNIERAGNPWKQPKRKRAAWAQGLDFEVPIMASLDVGAEVDVLWWVGCAGAYDPRNQKVTKAIARILHAAGVNFAILGEEETCTGDSARRAGNEYLFQQLAQQNIETAERVQVQADPDPVPPLPEHAAQRVSAVRRSLPGDAPHAVYRGAAARGADQGQG